MLHVYKGNDTRTNEDSKIYYLLVQLGLQKFASVFGDHSIKNYQTFLALTEANLREINIPVGARIKILKAIKRLKNNPTTKGTQIM